MWTKVVLDQKFLFDSDVEIAFRLKASWNAPIFDFDSKKWIFSSQVYIWNFKRANILARFKLQIYTREQKIHFLLSKSKIGTFITENKF